MEASPGGASVKEVRPYLSLALSRSLSLARSLYLSFSRSHSPSVFLTHWFSRSLALARSPVRSLFLSFGARVVRRDSIYGRGALNKYTSSHDVSSLVNLLVLSTKVARRG